MEWLSTFTGALSDDSCPVGLFPKLQNIGRRSLAAHGGCGSHAGQIFENLIEQAVEVLRNAGGAMPKMVIEVPDQFVEVGKAMAEHLAILQRTVDRLGGEKAVDYVAVEAAIAEGASRTELAAHGAILKGLDMDVLAVVIGGARYTRVGRCEGAYHTTVGAVSVER